MHENEHGPSKCVIFLVSGRERFGLEKIQLGYTEII